MTSMARPPYMRNSSHRSQRRSNDVKTCQRENIYRHPLGSPPATPPLLGSRYSSTPRTIPQSISTSHDSIQYPSLQMSQGRHEQSFVQTPGFDAGHVSPALANEHYTLAGGYDTPAALSAGQTPDWRGIGNYRGLQHPSDTPGCYFTMDGPLARERNGNGRQMNGGSQATWSQLVFGLVRGVSGKMFEFCCDTVFRGFNAAPGQRYPYPDLPTPPHETSDPYKRSTSAIPGEFPDEDDYVGIDCAADGLDPRPSKRLHTSSGLNDWVVVDHSLSTRDTSPQRISNRKTPSTLASTAPSRGSLSPSSATRVSQRRSLVPSSRKSSASFTSRISTTGSPLPPSRPSLVTTSDRRNSSIAPVRSPIQPHKRQRSTHDSRPSSSAGLHNRGSPSRPSHSRPSSANENISPEAKQYLARSRRQDKTADKSMSKMSRQVQDLIAQGQQALGTRVDVEDENEGPDFRLADLAKMGSGREGVRGGDGFEDEGFQSGGVEYGRRQSKARWF